MHVLRWRPLAPFEWLVLRRHVDGDVNVDEPAYYLHRCGKAPRTIAIIAMDMVAVHVDADMQGCC